MKKNKFTIIKIILLILTFIFINNNIKVCNNLYDKINSVSKIKKIDREIMMKKFAVEYGQRDLKKTNIKPIKIDINKYKKDIQILRKEVKKLKTFPDFQLEIIENQIRYKEGLYKSSKTNFFALKKDFDLLEIYLKDYETKKNIDISNYEDFEKFIDCVKNKNYKHNAFSNFKRFPDYKLKILNNLFYLNIKDLKENNINTIFLKKDVQRNYSFKINNNSYIYSFIIHEHYKQYKKLLKDYENTKLEVAKEKDQLLKIKNKLKNQISKNFKYLQIKLIAIIFIYFIILYFEKNKLMIFLKDLLIGGISLFILLLFTNAIKFEKQKRQIRTCYLPSGAIVDSPYASIPSKQKNNYIQFLEKYYKAGIIKQNTYEKLTKKLKKEIELDNKPGFKWDIKKKK